MPAVFWRVYILFYLKENSHVIIKAKGTIKSINYKIGAFEIRKTTLEKTITKHRTRNQAENKQEMVQYPYDIKTLCWSYADCIHRNDNGHCICLGNIRSSLSLCFDRQTLLKTYTQHSLLLQHADFNCYSRHISVLSYVKLWLTSSF